MKNKIYVLLGTFLLLVPFRLPISVLLINLFNYIAVTGTDGLPFEVLRGNVLVTKGVYALVMAILFQVNVDKVLKLTTDYGQDKSIPPWPHMLGFCLWMAYIIYDLNSTSLIFDMINK